MQDAAQQLGALKTTIKAGKKECTDMEAQLSQAKASLRDAGARAAPLTNVRPLPFSTRGKVVKASSMLWQADDWSVDCERRLQCHVLVTSMHPLSLQVVLKKQIDSMQQALRAAWQQGAKGAEELEDRCAAANADKNKLVVEEDDLTQRVQHFRAALVGPAWPQRVALMQHQYMPDHASGLVTRACASRHWEQTFARPSAALLLQVDTSRPSLMLWRGSIAH
jgi:hypothetical protein